MSSILESAKTWLTTTFDANTKSKVEDLIKNNPEELNDSFIKT